MHRSIIIFLLGLSCGFWQWLQPPVASRHAPTPQQHLTAPWPEHFEGQPLVPIPLTAAERAFSKDFPGTIASFRCGDQQVILRQVTRATRKLHPSADCLRASGHRLESVKLHRDVHGRHWAGCHARRGTERYFIRERIIAMENPDEEWTDVSSWFWHAQMAPDTGPWMAITLIRREP